MPTTVLPPLLAAGGSLVLSILGIGFLIFVHELGHFLACRLTRTRVETFSIGFGTRLFGWEQQPGERRRLTFGRRRLDPAEHAMDYRVSLVPLGGYVKMAGGEYAGEEMSEEPDEFPNKPIGARIFIICAGVVMNIVTAGAFYVIAYAGHVEQAPAVVGAVEPGSAAWAAGLEAGDRVRQLGGERVRSFQDLQVETVFLKPDVAAAVVVDRGGTERALEVVPRYDGEKGAVQLGVRPAASLAVEVDGQRVVIGPTDEAEVGGIRVRGGMAASDLLRIALDGTGGPVELVGPDGTRLTVEVRAAAPGADGAPHLSKVGIGPWADPEAWPKVKAARGGPAAAGFEPGDVLVALLPGGDRGPRRVGRQEDVDRSAFAAPLVGALVRRGEDTVELHFDAPTPAAAWAFLQDLALEDAPTSLEVAPLEAGRLAPGPDGSWYRYPSVPSSAAGLRDGDKLLSIAGDEVGSWKDVVERVGSLPAGKVAEFQVLGLDGQRRRLEVTPVEVEPLASPRLELSLVREPYPTEGFGDALATGLRRTGREVQNVFRLIGALFTGRISFGQNVAGPVTIVKVSKDAAETDWLLFLVFLAYISVTLAVLNILPIPMLDGGHLLFILIEKAKGSPMDARTLGRLQAIGLLLLAVLMFFAFRNDLRMLLS